MPAIEAEVTGCRDQALAKVVVPDPIDNHPQEQCIGCGRDPPGELFAAGPVRRVDALYWERDSNQPQKRL